MTEDALGSVRVVTDSAGDIKARRDFLPFGEEIFAGIGNRNLNQKYSANADDTRKKFATYQRDLETGLDYAQSRYYSPMQGRFTSPDEFKGGPDELFDFEEDASDNPTFYADLENPQSLNKYQYGYNNPYKYNDPNGHCPSCDNAKPAIAVPLIPVVIGALAWILSNPDTVGKREKKPIAEAIADASGILPGGKGIVGGIVGGLVKATTKGGKTVVKKQVAKQSAKTSKKITPEKANNLKEAKKKGIPKNQLGPSGKPKVVVKKMPTKKRAKDAARNQGQGKPVKDTNPTKGGSHYHSTNKDGSRKKGKNNVHYEYPLKRGKLPDK